MGLFDTLKSKLNLGQDAGDDEYADDGYDDYYEEGDGYGEEPYQAAQDGYGYSGQGYRDRGYGSEGSSAGVLGQTRRGEAESVAVYTRSGRLVGDADRHASTYDPPARENGYRPGAYDTPSSYASARNQANADAAAAAQANEQAARMNAVVNASPQLPVYILRPESYDDVETVVRRVRTRQPVALVFQGVRTEVAKRVLDFSYGFACGLGASVQVVGDRVFIVLPQGCEVKETDLSKLRSEGYLKN